MNNWQKVKIKDVTNKVVDNRGKTPKNNTECGIPLLEVNALTETVEFSAAFKFKIAESSNVVFVVLIVPALFCIVRVVSALTVVEPRLVVPVEVEDCVIVAFPSLATTEPKVIF